jgi:recombination protein RecA
MAKKKQKSRAAAFMREINSTLETNIMLGSDEYFTIERIPTGSLVIDRITGGGFALGRHYELYGDENCVTPGTLVLREDLSWDEIGNVEPGEVIVGFDEFPQPGRGCTRKLRKTEVISNSIKVLDCYEIRTDQGTVTVASEDHRWLTLWQSQKKPRWRFTHQLKVGDEILWFGQPWDGPSSYRAADYLAGLYDGEGWCDKARVCAFSQNPGPVLDRGVAELERLGFDVIVRNGNALGCKAVLVGGGLPESLRFAGQVNSARIDKDRLWVGQTVNARGNGITYSGNTPYATITRITHVGHRRVSAVATSTGTLVTDGLLSHNSGKSYVVYRTMALSQQRGNLVAIVDPEHSFDNDRFKFLGGDPRELMGFHPRNAEEAVAVMMILAKYASEREVEVVAVDSVSSLVPREELQTDPREEDRMAAQARMMSRALRRLTTVNEKMLFLWTNQERENVGIRFGNPRTTSGGRALRFYATGRIEFRRGTKVMGKRRRARGEKLVEAEVPVGRWTQVRVEKDKSTIPGREGAFVFDYGMKMIDPASEILQLGLEDGLIERSGNRFSYVDIDDRYWAGTRKQFANFIYNDTDLRQELEVAIDDVTKGGADAG